MALMVWNRNFVTGIDIIDEQHQGLIEMINAAAPLLAAAHDEVPDNVTWLLDELVRYAVFHFETEDRLMAESGIDRRHHDRHLASHGNFAAEVTRMRDDFLQGRQPSGSKLLSFLANWLIYHILGEDQALARQLQAIAAGMSPAEAYERAEGSRVDPSHESLTQALIDVYVLMTDQNRQLMENNRELARHRSQLEELVQARTADLMRALDDAQSANRARSSFIANMSHEIRTPMNAIVGLAWSLRQHTADTTQRLRLDQISDAAKQLLAIINDLLDMARIESDRLILEPLDFDPHKVLQETLSSVKSAATVKGLLLRLSAPPLPALLRGDPVRIGQIIGNFASNAVKFTERGRIEIRAAFDLLEPGKGLFRVEVVDTGPGIAPEQVERLFRPFGQLDDSTTRRHGGTGLGLAISQRLATMMGGAVGVRSQPGEGSTFWLEVPLATANGHAQPATAAPPAGAGTPPPASAADRTRQQEILRRLAALLGEDDVSAIPLWHESAPLLQELFDDRGDAFEQALNAYDFAAALALLRESLPEPAAEQTE